MFSYQIIPIEKNICLDSIVTAYDVVRPRGYYFSGEMHNFWEVVCVADGNATATADEKVYALEKGQIIFHKPMEFHRIWSSKESDVHLLILSFEAHGQGMDYFRDKCFSIEKENIDLFAKIVSEFEKIIEYSGDRNSNEYKYISVNAALMLEAFLLTLFRNHHIPVRKLDKSMQCYENIVNVLKEHCEEKLSVSDIAALCHLSESNLKQIFHKYCDIGIIKYFNALKIRRATELLVEGMSAIEISERLNFDTPNYFYCVFKRETKMTPKQYKERYFSF